MNAVSMSTKNLRGLLRKFAEKDLGYRVCVAKDITGPGGSVFIAARTELTQRHLSWLQQRNPARKTTPTYVDVVFSQQNLSTSTLTAELDFPAESPEAKKARQLRATEISRQVITRGEDVVQEAIEVFQIIGDTPFTVANLRSAGTLEKLEQLHQHVRLFHSVVKTALDEYLDGNTLIMDLITGHQGPHTVRHGLNVAVFATEMCSHILKGSGDDLEDYFAAGADQQAPATEPNADAAAPDTAQIRDQHFQLFKEELADIFLGGFMHDCGLWNESLSLQEGHEKMGAKLVWSSPELREFALYLANILLIHSDIVRLPTGPAWYGSPSIRTIPRKPPSIANSTRLSKRPAQRSKRGGEAARQKF